MWCVWWDVVCWVWCVCVVNVEVKWVCVCDGGIGVCGCGGVGCVGWMYCVVYDVVDVVECDGDWLYGRCGDVMGVRGDVVEIFWYGRDAGAKFGRGDGGEVGEGVWFDCGVGGVRVWIGGDVGFDFWIGNEWEDGGGVAAAVVRDVFVGVDVRVCVECGDEVVVDKFEDVLRRVDGGWSYCGGVCWGGGVDWGVGVSRGRVRFRLVGYSR